MKRLILYLIRRRLGLKKFELFQFTNQKSTRDFYYFSNDKLLKWDSFLRQEIKANVSLNWILDDECTIFILDPKIGLDIINEGAL